MYIMYVCMHKKIVVLLLVLVVAHNKCFFLLIKCQNVTLKDHSMMMIRDKKSVGRSVGLYALHLLNGFYRFTLNLV